VIRTSDKVRAEYGQHAAEAGSLSFQLKDFPRRIEECYKKMAELNEEYTEAVKYEAEQRAKANPTTPTHEAPQAQQ